MNLVAHMPLISFFLNVQNDRFSRAATHLTMVYFVSLEFILRVRLL